MERILTSHPKRLARIKQIMAASLSLLCLGHLLLLPQVAYTKSPAQDPAEAYLMQQLDDESNYASQKSTPLQGSITSLKVTKGRSQIIKFAQPIAQLSIAEPTLADVIPLGPDQVMINGKQRGVTSLIVWDENGQEGIFDLYVQNDTSEMLSAIKAIAPNEKINVQVTDDTFILTGQVSNTVLLDEIRGIAAAYGYRDSEDAKEDKFIDLTETPAPQVVLEVKIAETSRNVARNIKTSFSSNRKDLVLNRLGSAVDTVVLDGIKRTQSVTPSLIALPVTQFLVSSNAGGLTGSYQPQDTMFSTAWDLLEQKGLLTMLAEPTLVTTHGRTAEFLAGGEFPFPKGTDQSGSPIIEFREYGVKLNFTPWISVRTNRIELNVEPEVSSLGSQCLQTAGGNVCELLTRRTSTTVELMNGESLMISGIITRQEQNSFQNTPFVSDIPILGAFFKNSEKSKTDRELVVVITPHIVKREQHYGQILGQAY